MSGMWWLNGWDVVAQWVGCGGSMVVHQTVKPAVPGSNPASLQPAGTCHSLLGSQQGWHETAGWPLRGGRGKKKKFLSDPRRCKMNRKVRAPRRVSTSGAPNDVPNCHLDKTNMDNSSMHPRVVFTSPLPPDAKSHNRDVPPGSIAYYSDAYYHSPK